MKEERTVSYLYGTGMKKPVPMIKLSGKWLEDAGFGIGQKFVLTVEEGEIRLIRAETEKDTEEVEKGGNRANKAV